MGITLRRFLPALIMGAFAALALLAPAAANASVSKKCVEGANIHGEGSSLQNEAEEKWKVDFNTEAGVNACNGSQGEKGKPVVTYTKEASSVGMRKWGFATDGATRSDSTTQFVGTDQPPNAAQTAEMLTENEELKATQLETIPVVQEAVAVIVHLPAGCTATSTTTPGRFVLTQTQLEQVFAGEITKWNEITGGGTKWTGASCANRIERTVRGDGSGTTSIFKKYLNLIKESPEAFGGETWQQSAEEIENTTWPNEAADPVVRGKGGTGEASTASGGKLAEWVQKHEGEIGYAGIADARNKHIAGTVTERSANGQEGAQIYWVEVQYTGGASKPKYEEPAKNSGETGSYNSGTKVAANCEKTEYTDGKSSAKFPPENTQKPWNEATTSLSQKNYGICGMSYILAYDNFHLFSGFEESKTDTVGNYLRFVLGTSKSAGKKEGQAIVEKESDYCKLPASSLAADNVLGLAIQGAERVGY
jgi:ABC-type phosphate transport system substrate-binding protein